MTDNQSITQLNSEALFADFFDQHWHQVPWVQATDKEMLQSAILQTTVFQWLKSSHNREIATPYLNNNDYPALLAVILQQPASKTNFLQIMESVFPLIITHHLTQTVSHLQEDLELAETAQEEQSIKHQLLELVQWEKSQLQQLKSSLQQSEE